MYPDTKTPPELEAIAPGGSLPEEDLRLLVARVLDYAIFMLDRNGRVASWNDGAERIKGYSASEIIGQHISVFYLPDDAAKGHPQELLERARVEGRVEDEGWRVRKDGTRFWADVVITALRDEGGRLRGYAKVTRDITEQHQSRALIGDLSGRLLQLQDDERRRIARELHDTTSPLLTSLTGKLYAARQRARQGDGLLSSLVEEALSLAEGTATMVRTVASMLHPPLIDQGGLLPALRWYLELLGQRSGIQITSGLPETMPRLDPEHEITLFRTAQEWTGRAIAEGAASLSVTLRLHGSIEMIIETEGVQVSVGSTATSDLDVPIAAIRARLHQMHGNLVLNVTDHGTTFVATLPLRIR